MKTMKAIVIAIALALIVTGAQAVSTPAKPHKPAGKPKPAATAQPAKPEPAPAKAETTPPADEKPTNLAAFKSGAEPDGFRSVKWGSAYSDFSDMKDAFGASINGHKIHNYTKNTEDSSFAGLDTSTIRYIFCQDKFYGVGIEYQKMTDAHWDAITKTFLDQYGQVPELLMNNQPTYIWWGNTSFVRLKRSLDSFYVDIWSKFFFGSDDTTSLFTRSLNLGDMPQIKKMVEADPSLIKQTDSEGKTPLFWALDCHPKETGEQVIEYLISKGADVNAKAKDDTTPLQRAAQLSQLSMVKLLVSKGADVNLRGWHDQTALIAASLLHPAIAEYLIAQGADVTVKEQDGSTALHSAVEWGSIELVRLLISKGADVNARDKDGRSPLHYSVAMTGEPDAIKALIDSGADVNAKESKYGKTALHVAVDEYNDEAVTLLLASGANVNAKDDKGNTPLQYAIDDDLPKIQEILRQHGGTQ